jgi:hypothetical protein
MVPPCNWCGGTNVYDSNGCVIGWRCANGANPCTTLACDDTSNPCEAGYTCGSDRLCWPAGTGGAGGHGGTGGSGNTGGNGGTGGTGGTGGGGGSGGTGGMTGTGQVGVRCLNALCNTGQVCCVSQSSTSLLCTSPEECAGDLAVTCDGPEDCGGPGHPCCMPSGALMQTTCTTSSCLAGLAMCHGAADCGAGENCCSATVFGYSYGLCQTGACPP